MRKTFTAGCLVLLLSLPAFAQDSLKTVVLEDVVTIGTKFDLPVEKSGKTIFKLSAEDIERNAGKSVGDILNEVPGVQVDGNFSTPGANLSYYVRGGRNQQVLVLIDGVPLNDPSAISATYDLRYIPVSQVESIEVLKGGLSTLYGTGAAAAVVNITLKKPGDGRLGGNVDLNVASYNTFSQNLQLGGASNKLSYMIMANNQTSEGFTAAEDSDPLLVYDKDGFSRQNGLVRLGYKFNEKFKLDFHSAYEQFEAEYDDYEFTDGANVQTFDQIRVGINPRYIYKKGDVEGRVVYNVNEREFESAFPSQYQGRNWQAEIVHRHHFGDYIQTLSGVNFQSMTFDQKGSIAMDTVQMTLFDPYASLLVDLPVGLNVHAGIRLNTHNVYGSKLVYNVNPSFLFNKDGKWKYKVFTSVSTSYITPSPYQLFSIYGNRELTPEEALNYEAGFSLYGKKGLTFNITWFKRKETQAIDFVETSEGYMYANLATEREVDGFELSIHYRVNEKVSLSGNYSYNDTDRPATFYRIPRDKFGLVATITPLSPMTVSLKYNFTGERTTFYFGSNDEETLDSYQLVDVFASYAFLKNSLTLYGSVNNLFDDQFVGVYGYTTRGRNFSVGIQYKF